MSRKPCFQILNGIAAVTIGLVVIVISTGCQTLREQTPFSQPSIVGNNNRQQTQATPAGYKRPDSVTPPAQTQLIETLNARAAKVKQLNCPVSVKVPGAPKIKGTLQVEFPMRMRLKAGVMGVSELGVDAGSNDQQFWVWSKLDLPGSPAALYFANHREFQNSRLRRQIPLEPQQLINALGLVQIDPQGQHFGPFQAGNNRLQFYSLIQKNGTKQTRALLIDAATGAVQQTSLYDQNNRLVAYANAINFKNYDRYGVTLPSKVELHVVQPGQKDFILKVDLGTFSVNSLFGDPNQMWSIPQPNNAKRINLGAR
jgi:hypothetical protein